MNALNTITLHAYMARKHPDYTPGMREQLMREREIKAELLEALRDALCALECCGKDYPAATKARAAIAKATGAGHE